MTLPKNLNTVFFIPMTPGALSLNSNSFLS
ncbi:hypothetical protein F383_04988 [Gossypium arboreum]|uniref:Uncharacterized protein n=1 Tax=Gossypium arboreum TaxID=29729 RepID=A0A0B0NZR0_GOSAR|nr:hypothetical protein F383_04988 [Gossypium arboreum]